MKKFCPLRVAAQESDWVNISNMGTADDFKPEESNAACLSESCAWWNNDFGACAISALAQCSTMPVVLAESRGRR